jgi:hypothetical protein
LKARLFLWLLVIGVLSLAAEILVSGAASRRQLEGEKRSLESANSEKARLLAENARMEGNLRNSKSAKELSESVRQIAKIRSYLAGLQLEERRLKAELKLPDEPVWPDGATVRQATDWKFEGQATPEAALESVLATARAGDVDRLAGLIGLEESAKAKAEALFKQLPPSAQAEYGTPDKVLATLIAGQMPSDYAAMAVLSTSNPDPASALVSLRLEEAGGNQRDLDFKLQQVGGAWRLDVPAAVVASLGQRLSAPVASAK